MCGGGVRAGRGGSLLCVCVLLCSVRFVLRVLGVVSRCGGSCDRSIRVFRVGGLCCLRCGGVRCLCWCSVHRWCGVRRCCWLASLLGASALASWVGVGCDGCCCSMPSCTSVSCAARLQSERCSVACLLACEWLECLDACGPGLAECVELVNAVCVCAGCFVLCDLLFTHCEDDACG